VKNKLLLLLILICTLSSCNSKYISKEFRFKNGVYGSQKGFDPSLSTGVLRISNYQAVLNLGLSTVILDSIPDVQPDGSFVTSGSYDYCQLFIENAQTYIGEFPSPVVISGKFDDENSLLLGFQIYNSNVPTVLYLVYGNDFEWNCNSIKFRNGKMPFSEQNIINE
jgi:hypothetical protein